jgi:hypothetical protein
MRLKNRLVYILAILITLPLLGTVASAATIHVLRVFDYGGHANVAATQPQKVSDQSDIVGTVIQLDGTVQGFLYKIRDGRFSSAFSDPNDTGNFTEGRGINNRRHMVGDYVGSDGNTHGYLVKHPDFFEFDVAGAVDTIPLGINNAGSFVGTCMFSDGTQPAFVSLLQIVTTFAVPDAKATFACQISASNQIIGYYTDANEITHGYTRDSAGNLTFPIDVPGSTGTMLLGNNDSNWGVGSYTDASGVTHGLYFITPDDILTFDYPGATFTSLTGINRLGIVCGYYQDAEGIYHGLVAQVNP